jgi:hypothetical protein
MSSDDVSIGLFWMLLIAYGQTLAALRLHIGRGLATWRSIQCALPAFVTDSPHRGDSRGANGFAAIVAIGLHDAQTCRLFHR